ncbi:MAG: nucleotidyltransferase family protein [Ilumatobacteraceae bacterium]|nr:nucleotidyltransferase family protein [Ilumatobacteraceae bacterium]
MAPAVLGRLLSSQQDSVPATALQLQVALDLADQHRLVPAVWSHGVRQGWWEPLPADAIVAIAERFGDGSLPPQLAMQQAHLVNEVRMTDLLEQGAQILSALDRAGISAVPLKGWHAVANGWWPDPAEREMRDLDLLVPTQAAAQATSLLVELGYIEIPSGHNAYADHELPAVHRPGQAGSVELHTSLLVRHWAAVLPAVDVLSRSAAHDGSPMSTTDAITHLIAHAQLQDEAHLLRQVPLRAMHELTVLASGRRADEIDWPVVAQRFAGADATTAFGSFLVQTQLLFGLPAPVAPTRAARRAGRQTMWLTAHPALARRYRRIAYVPRGFSTGRQTALYGPGRPWVLRRQHLISRLLRRGPPAR